MTTRLTVLYDNEASIDHVETGWGFSCLVERDRVRLLFDTGWDGDRLVSNAEQLGIDLAAIGWVFISHNHWDHIGGLARLLGILDRPRVVVPSSISSKLKAEIAARSELVEVVGQRSLLPGLSTTGEIGDGIPEQALVIEVEGGVAVVTGCAHPGLDSLLAVAARAGTVKAVVGGFHGFDRLEVLDGVSLIAPCHCTTHKEIIGERFASQARRCGVGSVLEF